MSNLYDIFYGAGLGVAAPVWLSLPATRRKVLKALRERMGWEIPPAGEGPGVMIHAVSLGEINATRAMVAKLAEARPELRFIITTTTDTGFNRGRQLYGANPRVTLIHYPLDFTGPVRRVLDGLRPDVVVLMELEVWPNFVGQCDLRNIPVVLVNGRLTEGSFRNYRLGGPLVRRMFGRLASVCAQEQAYAERFIKLGAPADRVRITGTMKFDNAQIAQRIAGADELAASVGLAAGAGPIWVCGSTGPGEEELILGEYRRLLGVFPNLRLVMAPRKPERFDEVAELICGAGMELIRRSQVQKAGASIGGSPVILGDTMGELTIFYSLADVVFVGRTLVDLGARQHGSDMIEPAALAKPTVVGRFTGNFAEVMNQFRAQDAMREISSVGELGAQIEAMLCDPQAAAQMGRRAQTVVRGAQGATDRHVKVILAQLDISRQRPDATPV